ncbi:MAG: 23S rRNA pseudouridine(2605) synthase RluB [Arsenophonus sp. NC-WZS1-MAG3]
MNTKKQKSEKLQKILARCGYGSRREIESFIQSGRISVDGQLATLSNRTEVKPNIKIRLDGHLLKIKRTEKTICQILAYYKPEGELSTHHYSERRSTIFDRLPKLRNSRWIAIGRLDVNTSGLLLFTTDGELANRLMHPRHEVEREYAVRVFGQINDAKIHQLIKGVQLEDGKANFKKLKFCGGEGKNQWFNVTLTEGRNREVRRLWEAVGMQVSRLIRIRYGDIYLPKGLPRGGWIELCLDQINYLRQLVGLKGETTSKISVEKDRRHIKANQIRRAVKQHTQVSLIGAVNKREIGASKECNTSFSKKRDKIKGNIII